MENDFWTISWRIMQLIGFVTIWWYFLDLINQARKYLKQKNYNLTHKKVCDTCFEDLKNILKHIKGIEE